jgi:hypothetical protein
MSSSVKDDVSARVALDRMRKTSTTILEVFMMARMLWEAYSDSFSLYGTLGPTEDVRQVSFLYNGGGLAK